VFLCCCCYNLTLLTAAAAAVTRTERWCADVPSRNCSPSDAAAAAASSTASLPSFSSPTVRDSQPPVCRPSEQPAAKKPRLPPPSPSLLSTSSGSPPASPILLPVRRPVTAHGSSQNVSDNRTLQVGRSASVSAPYSLSTWNALPNYLKTGTHSLCLSSDAVSNIFASFLSAHHVRWRFF